MGIFGRDRISMACPPGSLDSAHPDLIQAGHKQGERDAFGAGFHSPPDTPHTGWVEMQSLSIAIEIVNHHHDRGLHFWTIVSLMAPMTRLRILSVDHIRYIMIEAFTFGQLYL